MFCRFGNCVPYIDSESVNPCDHIYRPGVDLVYISLAWRGGDLSRYIKDIDRTQNAFDLIPESSAACRDMAILALCHHFLPPCGNITHFEPPTAVCEVVCRYISQICPEQWELFSSIVENADNLPSGFTFINCSNTGEYLQPLPYCCVDAGIQIRKYILSFWEKMFI